MRRKSSFLRSFITTIGGALRRITRKKEPQVDQFQAPRRQTRYTYVDGPMMFLGQQIVKGMQDAGWPAKIHCCFRDPVTQLRLKQKGNSKAGPWRSPHQFYEAVDIIHVTKGWHCDPEFWDTLRSVTRIVGEKFGVEFECGYDWGWDMAHIELKDWRRVRDRVGNVVPTEEQLKQRFFEVLPKIAVQKWPEFRTIRK